MLKKVMLIALVAGVFTSCSSDPRMDLVNSFQEQDKKEAYEKTGISFDIAQTYNIVGESTDVILEDNFINDLPEWSSRWKTGYEDGSMSFNDIIEKYNAFIESTPKYKGHEACLNKYVDRDLNEVVGKKFDVEVITNMGGMEVKAKKTFVTNNDYTEVLRTI